MSHVPDRTGAVLLALTLHAVARRPSLQRRLKSKRFRLALQLTRAARRPERRWRCVTMDGAPPTARKPRAICARPADRTSAPPLPDCRRHFPGPTYTKTIMPSDRKTRVVDLFPRRSQTASCFRRRVAGEHYARTTGRGFFLSPP